MDVVERDKQEKPMPKKKRLKKSLFLEYGEICRNCGQLMNRKEHGPLWKPKANQPYYFKYWDVCKCGRVQLYEEAKVLCNIPTPVETPKGDPSETTPGTP